MPKDTTNKIITDTHEKDAFFRSRGYDRTVERGRIRCAGLYGDILDAGTGNGLSLLQLSLLDDVSVISIDREVDSLLLGQVIIDRSFQREIDEGERMKPDIEFIRADLTDLPFQDNRFDCAVAVNTLHHVPDWSTALDELVRVSKDIIVIQEFSQRGKRCIDRLMAEWDGKLRHRHTNDKLDIHMVAEYLKGKGKSRLHPGVVTDLLIVRL